MAEDDLEFFDYPAVLTKSGIPGAGYHAWLKCLTNSKCFLDHPVEN